MYASKAIVALALASYAAAIQVTSPTNESSWGSGTAAQTVSWEAVSTDPTSFVIQLVNQQGFLSNSPVTLIANQSTGSANVQHSVQVSYPSGTWPVGNAFQINLMSSSQSNAAILAQSEQFNITNTGSATSSGSASTTIASTSAQTTTSSTVVTVSSDSSSSTTSGNASGDIPNASASAKSAGELVAAPSGILGLLIAVAGAMGVFA